MNAMSATRATKTSDWAKPFGLLLRLIARWHRRQRLRRDEAWLLNQPDYLLRDIGIGRNEIEVMLRGGRNR